MFVVKSILILALLAVPALSAPKPTQIQTENKHLEPKTDDKFESRKPELKQPEVAESKLDAKSSETAVKVQEVKPLNKKDIERPLSVQKTSEEQQIQSPIKQEEDPIKSEPVKIETQQNVEEPAKIQQAEQPIKSEPQKEEKPELAPQKEEEQQFDEPAQQQQQQTVEQKEPIVQAEKGKLGETKEKPQITLNETKGGPPAGLKKPVVVPVAVPIVEPTYNQHTFASKKAALKAKLFGNYYPSSSYYEQPIQQQSPQQQQWPLQYGSYYNQYSHYPNPTRDYRPSALSSEQYQGTNEYHSGPSVFSRLFGYLRPAPYGNYYGNQYNGGH